METLQRGQWGKVGKRISLLLAAACLWAPSLLAPNVWASEVVDVRVGYHANYTRVVFELDSFVGYELEQHGSDLVVALDARARTLEILPSKGLIQSLEITRSGRGSAAHIQLTQGGLKLKEMTLANPPRIVIDVLSPGVAVDPIAQAKPPAAPIATAPVSPISIPVPDASSASSQASATKATRPSDAGDAKIAAERKAAKVARLERATKVETRTKIGAGVVRSTPLESKLAQSASPASRAVTPPPAVPSARKIAKPLIKLSGRRVEQPARTGATPAKPLATDEEEPAFGGPVVWAAAGIGLVFVAAAAILINRRRSETEFDDEEFADGLGDENPFADLSPDTNEEAPAFAMASESEETQLVSPPAAELPEFGEQEVAVVDPAEATEPVPFGQVIPQAPAAVEISEPSEPGPIEATEPAPFGQPVDMGVSDDNVTQVTHAAEERMPMDPPIAPGVDDLPLLHGTLIPELDPEPTPAPDVSADGGVTTPSLPAAGAGSVDVALLLKEIERRVAGIESRFDEVAEGSQRIERQVAAQTEELRVQRAAIARTQRAVRNMSRPDDASPTEPALRDPNAPRSGQ